MHNKLDQRPNRFESLEELLKEHVKLLSLTPDDSPESPNQDREVSEAIRKFLHRASATGVLLDAPKDRKQVQGILDYWQATSYFDARTSMSGQSTNQIGERFSEAVLASFDSDNEVGDAVRSIEATVRDLNADERKILRLILFRLVRIRDDGNSFVTKGTSKGELYSYGEPDSVQSVLDKLERAGGVRVTRNGDGAGVSYELSHVALIRKWPTLASWLENRTLFREATLLWERHKHDRAALNTGQMLDEAEYYNDLSDSELKFVSACRDEAQRIAQEKEETHRKSIEAAEARVKARNASFVSVVMTVFSILSIGLAIWAFVERLKANRANAEAAMLSEKMHAANMKEYKNELDLLDRQYREKLEKEEREKREIRERILMMVDFLRTAGDIATADSNSPSQTLATRRLTVLYDRAQALKDPILNNYLNKYRDTVNRLVNFSEDDRTSYRQSSEDFGIQANILEIAHELREYLRNVERHPEVLRQLDQLRMEYFKTVELVVTSLTQAAFARSTLESVRPYSDEFWRLYWGEMGLVEEEEVEKGMVRFGNALTSWEQTKNDRASAVIAESMKSAAEALLPKLGSDAKISVEPTRAGLKDALVEQLNTKMELPSFGIPPSEKPTNSIPKGRKK